MKLEEKELRTKLQNLSQRRKYNILQDGPSGRKTTNEQDKKGSN